MIVRKIPLAVRTVSKRVSFFFGEAMMGPNLVELRD